MAATKPPIPVGFAKAVMTGALGPTTWANVFYFAVTAGGHTPGEVIAAVAEHLHDFYSDACDLSLFTPDWSTAFSTITYRDAEDSLVRLRVADAMAGTSAADVADGQVCYLINWSTSDPRRGGKPRQYLSGVSDDNLADSARVQSTVLVGFNTRVISWLTEDISATIPMQLVQMSFRNAKTWRDAAVSFPILGGTMNPVIATQRRRVDRLRPH